MNLPPSEVIAPDAVRDEILADAPRRRAPMTYELITIAAYGYVMAALLVNGPMNSTDLAAYLADRMTPHDNANGALGVGWYPMSVARLMTQVQKHGYPVRRDPETGCWQIGTGGRREVRDAMARCFALAAVDPRPRMFSTGN